MSSADRDGEAETSVGEAGAEDPADGPETRGREAGVAPEGAAGEARSEGTPPQNAAKPGAPLHRRLTLALQAILVAGAMGAAWQGQWLTTFVTSAVVVITLLPLLLRRRLRVSVPPEFEAFAVLFVFASLFLGEVRGYYERFWWWDVALHTASGFLLGVLGFLLVYVLNESEEVEVHLRPRFVALFAFMFAVGLGAVWEIFEFAMDQIFGMNMQKEMLGDPSGLTDTMWDLIVDAVGAALISVLGYGYLRTQGSDSFLETWIGRFIDENPHMFEDAP